MTRQTLIAFAAGLILGLTVATLYLGRYQYTPAAGGFGVFRSDRITGATTLQAPGRGDVDK